MSAIATTEIKDAPAKEVASPKNDVPFGATFNLFGRKYADMSRVVLRDLNQNNASPVFRKWTKDKIADFLENPAANEKNLRDAAIYIYNASSHFRRLIQYFVSLSDLAYVVSPANIDTTKQNVNRTKKYYKETLEMLQKLDIRNQFPKILKVCLREDVFYGTFRPNGDSIVIQQLPSDYCKIAVVEDNVPNVSFNFSYFDTNSQYLPYYPDEFAEKYKLYKKDMQHQKWQELKAPDSFAVKCNDEILEYAVPPFAGVFREIYDIEDYKALKKARTELENYAILAMYLEMDDEGEWKLDYEKAVDFWRNLDGVLPEEVGSVLSPMKIEKIGFEKSNVGDTDRVAEAERNLFTAAGVSQLLFNSEKPSANALLLSIKVDQAVTYGIVKNIGCVLNRYLHRQSYGKIFKVTFLDCSPFNRKEMGDEYLKACQYGLPMISYFAATQGMSQDELDCMNYLENDVLDLTNRFMPLKSSATLSAKDLNDKQTVPGDKTGAPEKDAGELTEQGEQTREDA